jgi:FAD/FMN-containing dehydrogenase
MPIAGYNGIDEQGILLSTSNLTQLALSDDQAVVSIGAGNRWREVYSYLAPFGLAAVGGRVSEVGVSGFTLGGGISFYSNQYGFGSDNVVKFQVCLSVQSWYLVLIRIVRLSQRESCRCDGHQSLLRPFLGTQRGRKLLLYCHPL